MDKITNIRDMDKYVDELKTSFADKRNLYSELQKLQLSRGYNYDKTLYVKEKFPRFPNRLKLIIKDML